MANEAHLKIVRLRNLKPNWDSYGAPAISERAIKTALSVVENTQPLNHQETRVIPRADGGITLERDFWARCVISAEIDP